MKKNLITPYSISLCITCAVLALGFYLIHALNLDIKVSQKLYQHTQETPPLLSFLAEVGKYLPPILITIHFIYALRRKTYLNKGLYPLFVMIIGSGILVNLVFKPSFPRSRPVHCKELKSGAPSSFAAAFTAQKEIHDSSSFPSGHAGSAFALMAFAFLFYNPKKLSQNKKFVLLFIASLFFAAFIGWIRIHQGRHFLSDILGSFSLLLLTSLLLQPIFIKDQPQKKH